jgi:hypothetical protein
LIKRALQRLAARDVLGELLQLFGQLLGFGRALAFLQRFLNLLLHLGCGVAGGVEVLFGESVSQAAGRVVGGHRAAFAGKRVRVSLHFFDLIAKVLELPHFVPAIGHTALELRGDLVEILEQVVHLARGRSASELFAHGLHRLANLRCTLGVCFEGRLADFLSLVTPKHVDGAHKEHNRQRREERKRHEGKFPGGPQVHDPRGLQASDLVCRVCDQRLFNGSLWLAEGERRGDPFFEAQLPIDIDGGL